MERRRSADRRVGDRRGDGAVETTTRPPAHNYPLAASYALAGFTGWVVSDALLKLVRSSAVPEGQMLLISAIGGMAVIFLITGLRGRIKRLQPRDMRGLFALGVCQTTAFVCWIAALPHLALTSMYPIAFMTPMAVASLAALILKEQLGLRRAVPIACGFAGVVVAVNPPALFSGDARLTPYLFVFGSMLSTATQMLILRVVSQHEATECTSFYPRLVLLGAGATICALHGFVAMSPLVFLGLLASGALGGLGWALMSKAYKNAPAAAVAPFHYSQMVTGALLGYLIWGDVPGRALLIGAAIIIASGFYLVRHERRVSRTIMRVD